MASTSLDGWCAIALEPTKKALAQAGAFYFKIHQGAKRTMHPMEELKYEY
jgi:hypothetical protein